MKEPTSFFTYNNGIAVVARSIELSSDGNYIKSFKDFQIINGGQTTASLASSIVKKDAINELEGVFVPMKLTVLNVDDELTEEELDKYNDITRSISACANSQNPVSDADFFSNHPFHKAMESLSLKFPAPPVNGNPFETVWFYERSRGKWEQEMLKMTETQKNKYQEKYPRKQVVKKEKLAKCLNTIEQNPHQVCAGNAKNMKEFSSTIDKLWESSKDNINEHFFKKAIASVILFDSVDHIVATSDWYPKGGNKAQIVPYTIAKILSLIPKEYDLDWKMIWQRQTLYPALVRQIESMALQTHNFLLKSNGVIVREYAKKAETWKKFRDEMKLTLDDEFFMTLIMKKETKTEAQQAKREHKFNDGIDAALKVYSLGTEYWLKVYSDLEEKAILSSGNRDFIKSIAGYIQRGNLPSNAQAKKLLKIVNDAENEGYVMP